jgi:hypothetical protein
MTADQKYYAHYNKDTKQIYGIGNSHTMKQHKYNVEISFKEYLDFIEGRLHTHSFFVDSKKIKGKTTNFLEQVSGNFEETARNAYTIIDNKSNKSTEVSVIYTKNLWTFSLSNKIKKDFVDNIDKSLIFFVVDKNDLNKLISTMVIDTAELFSNGTVAVKNQDKFNIESHLLTTRAVFKKYGLEIND